MLEYQKQARAVKVTASEFGCWTKRLSAISYLCTALMTRNSVVIPLNPEQLPVKGVLTVVALVAIIGAVATFNRGCITFPGPVYGQEATPTIGNTTKVGPHTLLWPDDRHRFSFLQICDILPDRQCPSPPGQGEDVRQCSKGSSIRDPDMVEQRRVKQPREARVPSGDPHAQIRDG